MSIDLNDLKYFADRYRAKYKTSGPHWSAVVRIPAMYDEIVRLQGELDEQKKELVYWQTRAGNDEIIIREAIKNINVDLDPGLAVHNLTLHMEDDNK